MDVTERCDHKILPVWFMLVLILLDRSVGVWFKRDGGADMYFTGEYHGKHLCDCSSKSNSSDIDHGGKCNCCYTIFIPEIQPDHVTIINVSTFPKFFF